VGKHVSKKGIFGGKLSMRREMVYKLSLTILADQLEPDLLGDRGPFEVI